ncbi:hypothetical protein GSI_14909 [Ganoderma sinense ZZ0214-1]|uniref:Transporter n=1 Tax=Ganoderma sinense ZZ0214-1 TaxID=1077348 RepID=A0A2G8RQ15_9APHY|nr:hypothetical protein GSI_14909 [Ganoderma sinense ZZ0214-1]
MQFSRNITHLALLVLALSVIGAATPLSQPSAEGGATVAADEPYFMSHEQMMHWIANTDANLTFIGKSINPLTPRSARDTMVTYCSSRILNVCGGPCTVYNGSAKCLSAPATICLAATKDVAICTATGCTGDCTDYYNCTAKMSDGFCSAPDTQSIFVSGA